MSEIHGELRSALVPAPRQRTALSVSRFLSAVARADAEKILVMSRRQRVSPGDVLFQPGDAARYVFFPERATIVSLVHVFDCGSLVDTGIIGEEGVAGAEAVLGMPRHAVRGVVQSAGAVWRADAATVASLMQSSVLLRAGFDRFLSAFTFQLSQTAACNRVHCLEQRMTRALLLIRDRTGLDEIRLTHDTLAQMLGARRAGVTLAIGRLAREGALAAGRGRVRIVDAALLQQASCECYGKVAREYDLMMSESAGAGRVEEPLRRRAELLVTGDGLRASL